MGLIAGLNEFAVAVIGGLGYPGLFGLMVLESTLTPVPSTVVMGYAGYLAWQGTFTLPLVLLVALAGALVGSLFSYALGLYGGRPLVERYGKWFLIGPREIAWTDDFFARRGALAVFVGRFLPGVRHVVSIPAGAARMPMRKFLPATAAGAFAWNGFLAYVGFSLGPRWESVLTGLRPYETAIALAVAALLAVFVVWKVRRLRAPAAAPAEDA